MTVRIASGTCLSGRDIVTQWLQSAMQSAPMLAHESPFALGIRHLSGRDSTSEPLATGGTNAHQPPATTTASTEPNMSCGEEVSEMRDDETGVQLEPPVYHLDGGNCGIPLKPKEVQNEVRDLMNATLAKIGLTHASSPNFAIWKGCW